MAAASAARERQFFFLHAVDFFEPNVVPLQPMQ